MKITREQAINVIESITNQDDPYWDDLMDRLDLYDEDKDDWPSIFDVFEALGISEEEYKKATLS